MNLSDKLQTLHNELGSVSRSELAPETVARLKDLAGDIERILATTDSLPTSVVDPEANAPAASLQQRLQHSIEAFEVEHPQLTKVLSIIAERLADMGI